MAARSWQDTIRLKTYPLGPEDPNPPFQRQGGSWAIYPYTMQDDLLEGPPEERDYIALHLENEYLHCIVLPELGGRVHSLRDKVTGREVFYRNHVVKYGLVALRGAWISGGIEFNFPTGHTYTTVSPVSWEVGRGGDEQDLENKELDDDLEPGWAWIAVGNICRLSRMEWWVRLSLGPRQRVLRQDVWLENRMSYKQRYWFWSNAAVPATNDLRLVFPAHKARTAQGIVDYPVTASGWDMSWYRNHDHADDIFTLEVVDSFFGCHYVDADFGMINVASPFQCAGRKFFTWGTADDGMIWVDLLTDHDGQYVELQSGRFETQSIWGFLKPHQTVHWTEWWMPVHGMGGWVCANEHAALNLEIKTDTIRIGAMVTAHHDRGLLLLEANGRTVYKKSMALQPTRPFSTEIPMPQNCTGETKFVLRLMTQPPSAHGPGNAKCLIECTHPPRYAREPKVAETGENKKPPRKPEEACTAEELCVRATDALRELAFAEARRLCEKALAMDHGLAQAHCILGLLALRSGLYEQAVDHLEQALARDPENTEARNLLVAALSKTKQDVKRLVIAIREAIHRGEEKPVAHIVAAAGLGPKATWEPEDEKEDLALPEFLDFGIYGYISPRLVSAAEYWKRLTAWARDDVYNWLEFALGAVGSITTQISRLERAIRACPAVDDYPMTHYCLAFWYASLGRSAEASQALERARACAPDYCFPSRLEELEALEWAVAQAPDDWKARYYLGNVLASLDRTEEAMAQWREAVRLHDGFAVLHRNLGLGALRWENNPTEAAEHYHRAIQCNPLDYRYYLDLSAIYRDHPEAASPPPQRQETAATRLALLLSAPAEVQEKWQIAAEIAALKAQLGEYDDALAILGAHRFFPWEGATHMRRVYVDCLLAKGEAAAAEGDHQTALECFEAAMEYPRNLGVGKPARPHDARIYWLAAREAAALGDEDKRMEHLIAASQEPHAGPCEADWWKLLALRELGRREQATELETQLRKWAEGLAREEQTREQGEEMLRRLASRTGDA